MIWKNFGKKLFFFTVFLVVFTDNAHGASTTASWYMSGKSLSNGTSISLNVADSLVLTCKGTANLAMTSGYYPAFVITKGSAMTSYTQVQAVAATTLFTFTASTGGTLIYDTVNGAVSGYDNILVVPNFLETSTFMTTGSLSIYNPYVRTADAGTYYCNFVAGDGSASTVTDAFATSGTFTLTVTTKSGQSSSSNKNIYSKPLKYAMLIAASSKILL
jgi:hypothetical protein